MVEVPAATTTLIPRTLALAAAMRPVRPVNLAPPRSRAFTPVSLYCLVSGSNNSGAAGRGRRIARSAGAGLRPTVAALVAGAEARWTRSEADAFLAAVPRSTMVGEMATGGVATPDGACPTLGA